MRAPSTRPAPEPIEATARVASRFIFQLTIARHDRALVARRMRSVLGGIGSIQDIASRQPNWLPLSTYRVALAHSRPGTSSSPSSTSSSSRRPSATSSIAGATSSTRYERVHPTQWGRGPSTCSEPGCDKPVRGRGLCRSSLLPCDRLLNSRITYSAASSPRKAPSSSVATPPSLHLRRRVSGRRP